MSLFRQRPAIGGTEAANLAEALIRAVWIQQGLKRTNDVGKYRKIGKSRGARGIPKLVVKLMACHAEHGSNGNEMAAFFMLVMRKLISSGEYKWILSIAILSIGAIFSTKRFVQIRKRLQP